MRRAWIGLLAVGAAAAAFQGYTDTPFLPGGKWRVHDANRPMPKEVEAPAGKAPSDAIVLFDGSNLDQWTGRNDRAGWKVENGYFEVARGAGTIRTRKEFGDIQLHLEFATPAEVRGSDQGRGNSGVFLMGRYEIQILDNYKNKTYADGHVGSLYGMHPPLVNPSRPPGEWQTYDIIFTAPRFEGDKVVSPARATVFLNGVLVQNNAEYYGPSGHRSVPQYAPHGPGPIQLQDHGNPVRFRNVWVREL